MCACVRIASLLVSSSPRCVRQTVLYRCRSRLLFGVPQAMDANTVPAGTEQSRSFLASARNPHHNRTHGNKYHHHKVSEERRQHYRKNHTEQSYATPLDPSIDTGAKEEEVGDVATACARLWNLDLNRLTPGKDYEIDVAGEGSGPASKSYSKEDMLANHGATLFSHLSSDVFTKPTYARFYSLLDNYHASELVTEKFTPEQEQEQVAFVEEISRTGPFKYLQSYLTAKQLAPADDAAFKEQIRSLWFKLYDRDNTFDSSSAFEHVFVGEIKEKKNYESVSGFHNWIQFYLEESRGNIEYEGYLLPNRNEPAPDSQTQLLTIRFKWKGELKPESSTFIGVSPEFELALYTLCFYAGHQDTSAEVGPYKVDVKVYSLGKNNIGSAFPIAK